MILPPEFIERTQTLLGQSEYQKFQDALGADSPISIRMNSSKSHRVPSDEMVSWTKSGFYLPQRFTFTFDPLLHAGVYYVQEASSMFLEQAVRKYITEPVNCLDLCAAPGGKSTHLSSLLPKGSLLVSNEVIRSRSVILAENLMKWGDSAHIVTNNDPAEIGRLTGLFDVIVTDVPCSGEGMFRKDPASINEWSSANVSLCASRQRRILQDVWSALKPGGILIYSTCTYNTEENEENVSFIVNELGAEALPVETNSIWQVENALKYDNPVYRFFPHKTRGEGFFMAVLRKSEQEETVFHRRKEKQKTNNKKPLVPDISGWLLDDSRFIFEMNNSVIRAFPKENEEIYRTIEKQLRIVTAGIPIGEQKGKDIIPNAALALSNELNTDAFPVADFAWEEAIRYLKKETFPLPEGVEKGYVLIAYKGHPLGFVKNLGNRVNNLYPSEWRIRSGYLPEEIRIL